MDASDLSVRLLVLLTTTRLPAADPAYQLRVVTDRKDAIYEAGTEAKFLITVSKGDEVIPNAAMKFVVDDFLKSAKAAGLPVGSVTTTDQPAASRSRQSNRDFSSARCRSTTRRQEVAGCGRSRILADEDRAEPACAG